MLFCLRAIRKSIVVLPAGGPCAVNPLGIFGKDSMTMVLRRAAGLANETGSRNVRRNGPMIIMKNDVMTSHSEESGDVRKTDIYIHRQGDLLP